MAQDEALLNAARTARDRLDRLHDEAKLRRAAYYQAIRQLHASGGSMREIADALGLSHQGVHQIVNGGVNVVMPARKLGLLERRVGRRSGAECGPGHGGSDTPGDDLADRFFVDAREAMSLAAQEAELRGDDCIGTELLLLGLLATEHGLAARILSSVGADSGRLRRSVDRIVGKGPGSSRSRPRRLLPRAKKVLELARREAKSLRSPHIRSEHLLLAIVREGDGVGAWLLHELGLGYEQLRRRVDRAGVVCSFCGRSGFDVAHLIVGPGVFICEHCVEEASDTQVLAEVRSGSFMRDVAAAASDLSCSFCGKRRADVERLVAARPPALICDQCIELCREIRDDELG